MPRRPPTRETDLQGLGDRMHSSIERALGFVASPRYCLHATWLPSIDLFRSTDGIVLVAELPGIAEEDLRVSVDDGRLHIAGVRRPPTGLEQAEALQLEIDYGPFERIVDLPGGSDSDRISAHFRHGLLTVRIPLRAPTRVAVPITQPTGSEPSE